jgi:uncharacterized membrane protein
MMPDIFLLVLAIPAGFLLSWMAKDELKEGKKWFKALFIISLILTVLFLIYGISYAALTSAFVAIVSLISLIKGCKRKGFK